MTDTLNPLQNPDELARMTDQQVAATPQAMLGVTPPPEPGLVRFRVPTLSDVFTAAELIAFDLTGQLDMNAADATTAGRIALQALDAGGFAIVRKVDQ